jgi:hypothetical protein
MISRGGGKNSRIHARIQTARFTQVPPITGLCYPYRKYSNVDSPVKLLKELLTKAGKSPETELSRMLNFRRQSNCNDNLQS